MKYPKVIGGFLSAGVALIVSFSAAALEQETQEILIKNPLAVAMRSFQTEHYSRAIVILDSLKRAPGFKNNQKAIDVDFLLARALYKNGQQEDGKRLINQIILHHPRNAAAKVALAEFYILETRGPQANALLREALALEMPEKFRTKLETYLQAKKETKPVRFNFGFSIIPDTNINVATNSDEIEIFGLPFALSDEARGSSGIGLQPSAGVDYKISQIGPNAFVSTSIEGRYTAYSNNSEFNYGLVSGQVGTSYAPNNRTALRINFKGFYSNFGGESFNYGFGVEGIVQIKLNKDQLIRASLTGFRVENELDQNRDAFHISARVLLRNKLSDHTGIEGYAAIERENAHSYSLSNTIFRIGAGFQKNFDTGISIYINPEAYIRPFDERLAIFPERRKDKHLSVSLAASNQSLEILGLVPSVRLVYDKNYSNLSLFEYSRTRFFIQFNKSL